jgi:two-component system cell cycle sensor histidine kinase/response regulator CckA
MKQHYHLLLVEDSHDDCELLVYELRKFGFKFDYTFVSSKKEMIKALEKQPDAIISDYAMEGFSGFDALEIYNSKKLDIPFILVSGTIGEETAVEAMRMGASDYLMKDKLTRLGPALIRELKDYEIKRKHKNTLQQIKEKEEHLNSLLSNPGDYAIYRLEAKTGPMDVEVILYSPSITKLVGIDPDNIKDFTKWFQNVQPDDIQKLIESNAKGSLPPFKFDETFRINHPEKGLRWLHVKSNGLPYPDNPQKIQYADGIITDVTDRQKAIEKLKESEEKYKNLIQNQGEGIGIVNLNEEFVFANPAAHKIFGVKEPDLIGKK